MGPAHQIFRPPAKRRVALCHMGGATRAPWIDCLRRYLLPRLLIPSSFRLPPGGELSENQTEPGGEIAAVGEALRSTDGRNEIRRDNCAEARNRGQPASLFVLFAQWTNSVSKATIRRSSSVEAV